LDAETIKAALATLDSILVITAECIVLANKGIGAVPVAGSERVGIGIQQINVGNTGSGAKLIQQQIERHWALLLLGGQKATYFISRSEELRQVMVAGQMAFESGS